GGRVSGTPPQVTAKPAPAPIPRPTPAPRPSAGPGAAKPIPATSNPPLAAAPVPASATTAAEAGVVAGPDFAKLGVPADQATAALMAFRLSCPSVQRRTDGSGLTQGADWTESCSAAANWPDTDAGRFFARYFGTVQV